MPAFWVLLVIAAVLQWKTRKPGDYRGPSAAWSGTSVVALTGSAANLFLGADTDTPGDFLLLAVVAAITVVITFFVYRFARRHENQIGEARFDPNCNAR